MKNKKRKYLLVSVLAVVLITGVYLYRRHIENVEREAELEMTRREMFEEISYSALLFFDNSLLHNEEIFTNLNLNLRFANSTVSIGIMVAEGELPISEVVFVNSAEEAEGFGEDVLVAWPTEASDLFLGFINDWIDPDALGLGQFTGRPDLDISDLDVEFPLPRELMVEDWELMLEIIERIDEITGRGGYERIRGEVVREIGGDLRRQGWPLASRRTEEVEEVEEVETEE